MSSWWVLWFVISIMNGQIHVPVDEKFYSLQACEDNLDYWEELVQSQFPDDKRVRVYCEKFHRSTVDTEEL